MWQTVELREIRVFLVLAEELHFGRTAERLGLTQSRVSQSLRALEHKLGQRLLHRTSRRVGLTPAGERFRADASVPYEQLISVLQRTHGVSRSLDGTLRIGLLTAASGGAHMITIISRFEAEHPGCEVEIVELPFRDRYEPLRRGEIDLMATRIPLEQPDLVVGPTLSSEPRVLAVARDHPLAERSGVSIEDIADYEVAAVESIFPKELATAFLPLTTPTGRTIRRRREELRDISELITLVARGKLVHPSVASFGAYFAHPNVVYLPITDMPPSRSALVWRRRSGDPKLREFIRIARLVT